MEATIMDGARKATRAYLERRDFEVLEEGWAHGSERVDLIAREDGDMVFVDVVAADHGPDMPEERPDRSRFERLAAAYLAEHPDGGDFRVRYDVVSILVVNGDRALLGHHRNALGVL